MAQQHICGACQGEFASDAAYASHTCPATNETPADIAHLDALTNGRASRIAEKALERGAERNELAAAKRKPSKRKK